MIPPHFLDDTGGISPNLLQVRIPRPILLVDPAARPLVGPIVQRTCNQGGETSDLAVDVGQGDLRWAVAGIMKSLAGRPLALVEGAPWRPIVHGVGPGEHLLQYGELIGQLAQIDLQSFFRDSHFLDPCAGSVEEGNVIVERADLLGVLAEKVVFESFKRR